MKKWMSYFVVLTLFASIFTGCGKKEEVGGEVSDANGKEVVRIVVAGIGDTDVVDPISGITSLGKDKFEAYLEERLPDIDIVLNVIPWDGWIQKMETVISSGEADVGFYTNQVMAPDWFIDHSKFLESDKDVNFDNWDSIFVEPALHYSNYKSFNYPEAKGKVYGLPITMANNLMVYDAQLFEEWGVEPPNMNSTYEEIVEKAKLMTGKNPKTGIMNYGAFIKSYWMEWHSVGFGAVKPLQSETMMLNELDEDEFVEYIKESPEVLNYFSSMASIVESSPAGITTGSGGEKIFTKDNDIAIVLDPNIGSQLLKYTYAGKTDITDRFKPILMPASDSGYQGFPEFFRFAVTKNAVNEEAAWEVIKAIATNKEINNFYLENYAFDKTPALKDTSGMSVMDNDLNKVRHEYQQKTCFVTDDYWNWRVPMQKVLSKLVAKEITPEEARTEFYEGVTDWINSTKLQLGQ